MVSAQQEPPQGQQSDLKVPTTSSANRETALNMIQAPTGACMVDKQATTVPLVEMATEPSDASFKYIGVQVLIEQ